MNRLLRWALRNGWRKGVLSGSRPWLAAGAAALGVRMLQRLSAKEEAVVYREQLGPGESLLISHKRPD